VLAVDVPRDGDGAVVGAQGGVTKSIPEEACWSGYPARDHQQAMRQHAALTKLPDVLDEIRALARRVAELEGREKTP